MKILALVPARGGSKRLPKKNILLLGGKPLINWTIEAAKDIPEIIDIIVSTDSPEIASIAEAAGAFVPWLRPKELSTDTSTSVDVCIHTLDWYENHHGPIDGLLLLQPTSPFRKRESIVEAIDVYALNNFQAPIISVTPAKSHPSWCYAINGNTLTPFINGTDLSIRSQDLSAAYVINGAIYLAKSQQLRDTRSFMNQDAIPLVMNDSQESLDIDTQSDWLYANFSISTMQNYK